MGTLTQKTREDLERLFEDLTAMRDELRVRLHLAGMEAKEKYGKLDEEIFELSQRAKRVGEDGAHEVKELLQDAKKRLESLRNRVLSA
jgi:hypothetical protein